MRAQSCCVLVLVFAAVLAARADDWNKTYTVTGKPEVRVEADDGSIHVLSGGQREVRAEVSTCGWKIGPNGVRVAGRQTGNRIEITVQVPSGPHILVFGCRSVRVDLSVPAESDLDLRTKDGRIEAADVKGRARLDSGDGRIEARGMDGSLKASTRDGRVSVDGRFDVLTVHTGDGRIEADVLPGSKMAGGWTFRTGDGSVSLRLPRDLAANLDARTGDGKVVSDFPLTVSEWPGDSNSMRGKINGGGPILEIRTGDGNIQVMRY